MFAIFGGIVWTRQLDRASALIPKLDELMAEVTMEPTKVLAADGSTLFVLASERREPVTFSEIPQPIIEATLAAEDHRFYQHSGVDPIAAVRQLVTNAREQRIAGGASTLTMQLAKRLYSESERTLDRKLQDMALAVMMERELTKNQIIELYLNQIFYGSGAYGIRAAADVYFGKELEDLTLAETALLVRIPRRPSDQNPFRNPDRAIENRNVVLALMLEQGRITQAEHDAALQEPLKLAEKPVRGVEGGKKAPYFVDYVLSEIERTMPDLNLEGGGYVIETTLDPRMQRIAEQQVRDLVRNSRGKQVTTAACLLIDRTGRIKAMVGGVDYERNQYNALTQGRRQPGSAFKPFVYAIAIDEGTIRPTSYVSNVQIRNETVNEGKPWPRNANGRYGGSMSVRSAIQWSTNVPAVHVLQDLGPSLFVTRGREVFGFDTKFDPQLALALGSTAVSPIELAEAYTVFMLEGMRTQPYGVRRIIDRDGTVLANFVPSAQRSGLKPATAKTMDGFLRVVATQGTGARARSVANVRGKTGTTNDNRDAWFVGYSDELLCVSWVANERRDEANQRWIYEEMASGVYGGNTPIQMWTGVMSQCQKLVGEKSRDIETPQGSGERQEEDAGQGEVEMRPGGSEPDPFADRVVQDQLPPPTDAVPRVPSEEPPAPDGGPTDEASPGLGEGRVDVVNQRNLGDG